MNKAFIVLALLAVFSWPVAAQQKAATKPKTPPTAGLSAALEQGKKIYIQNYLTCHQADGGGVQRMNPPLSNTSYVLGDKTRLVKVLLNGLQDVDIDGESYSNVMPAYDQLTDQEIAAVLTYVRNSFGNKATPVDAATVKTVRAANKK